MKMNKHVLSHVILFTHKAINTEPPISTCKFHTFPYRISRENLIKDQRISPLGDHN